MRIGNKEKEILEHLISCNGKDSLSSIGHKFSPYYHKCGDKSGATLFSVTIRRLDTMASKGLVIFRNRYRTDCVIEITSAAQHCLQSDTATPINPQESGDKTPCA